MARRLTETQKLRKSLQAKVRRMQKKGEYVPESVKQQIKEARYQTLKSMRRDKFSRLKGEIEKAFKDEGWESSSDYNIPFDGYEIPYQGDIIYDNVIDMIDTYPSKGSTYLRKRIKEEIRQYGRDAVVRSMSDAGEELVTVARTIAVYDESAEVIHDAIVSFFEIIHGYMPNNSETEEMADMMDEL